MKLYDIVKKDSILFVRDTKTLAITILTPILILSILAMIFSNTGAAESITGITLGFCNLDDQPHKEIEKLPMFEIRQLHTKNCEKEVQEQVKEGKLRGAIIIPANFTKDIQEGRGAQLQLYVDAAKSQTAIVTRDSFKALTQDLNEQIGTAFIEQAWVQLRELNKKLKIVVTELEQAQNIANQLETSITSYTQEIEALNSNQTEAQLEEVSVLLENYVLADNSTINLNATINVLHEAVNNAQGAYTLLCSTPEPGCAQLQTILIQLQALQTEVVAQQQAVELLVASQQQALQTFTQADNKIQIIQEQVQNITALQNNSLQQLQELLTQIRAYKTQSEQTIKELQETTRILDVYTAREPISILHPVNLQEHAYYGQRRYVENLTPGIIGVLLLFITLLVSSANIIQEQKSGTLTRNLMSPTRLVTILAAKLIYFLLLTALQLVLMIITLLFFGIYITLSPALLFVLFITAISFSSVGICIASFAKTEETALLTSLVLSIPMMFLAGVFFPFEVMPKFIQIIGQHLPLTLSIINVEQILTYQTVITLQPILESSLLSILLLIIAYYNLKRNSAGS